LIKHRYGVCRKAAAQGRGIVDRVAGSEGLLGKESFAGVLMGLVKGDGGLGG
jgi:hypothetical protein